ncbi:colicin transporter [Salmonella enterica]|nr:colicin transporter [Salmonella enterica]EKO8013870.1 colicin transporter [Salmonella enterica]
MNKKYYIQNMCWGWIIGGIVLYLSWDDNFKFRGVSLFICLFGIILYPLAKWGIEWFFLKFTTREFWNSGFFIDTPGKMGLLAIYSGTVFLLSIPITIILIITVLIKRLLNK